MQDIHATLAADATARAGALSPWLPPRVTLACAMLYFVLFGAEARTLAD